MKYKSYQFKPLKRPKYGNRRCTAYGFTFDSMLQRERYLFLRSCQENGIISELECEPKIELSAYGHHICDFYPDFRYRIKKNQHIVYEDVKGGIRGKATMTADFRIKKKLFFAMTGYEVKIVTRETFTAFPEE